MGKPLEPLEIRKALIDAVARERRDKLIFSVSTILLTPALVALAVFFLVLAVQRSRSSDAPLMSGEHLVHGTNMFLLSMMGFFFIPPEGHPGTEGRDLVWWALGLLVIGLIVYFSYRSPLRVQQPSIFWPLYGTLAFVMLGVLGRGYVPRDHYYVRPGEWSFGDSAVEQDLEQGEFLFGFAQGFAVMVLGSYGDILGSGWLWNGLDERGLWVAAEVLHDLGAKNLRQAEERLRQTSPQEAGRVVRWILKMGYVRIVDRHYELTPDGERFIGVSQWTVA
jgi:hypothetical protein